MKRTDLSGLLLVNKPSGMTSHDVVDFVRKKFEIKKVGHAGTLDPMATGLLIILIGKATKLSNRFSGMDKAYESRLTLGVKTDSADSMGKIIEERPVNVSEEDIRDVFSRFVGEIEQVPPMVSAIRHKGKRLYELARKGITVERPKRKVKIYSLEIKNIDIPNIDFEVSCSKGTYIRTLCEDIGEALGCGGHQSRLHRTRIGDLTVEMARDLDDIDESAVQQFYSW